MNPFRHRLKTGWNLNACQCETACACKVFAVYPTGAADASWLIEEMHQASARAEPSGWVWAWKRWYVKQIRFWLTPCKFASFNILASSPLSIWSNEQLPPSCTHSTFALFLPCHPTMTHTSASFRVSWLHENSLFPPPVSLHSRLRSLYLRQATKSCVPFGLRWNLQSSLPVHRVRPAACLQPSYPSEEALATLQAALYIAYEHLLVKLLQMLTDCNWMLLPLNLILFLRTVENLA